MFDSNKDQILEIYSRNNIYLDTSLNILYISDKKIYLNTPETLIVKCLLQSNGYCNKKDFMNCLENLVKEQNLIMILCRLKRKIKYSTGYTIIKNRYKKGYYIAT